MKRLQGLLKDRKTLYLVLGIVIVSVFTLSIAYAAMEAVLEIHGNSEVVASSWNIHLENVKVKSGSVSANAPQISGTSTLSFDVDLNIPGEFYEFTVDVVNEGSIDAMIDSVVKTPDLTSEQAKYIKYEVTYENGESISTKQTLKKGTSTPIKVRVEYRKDIIASDLPSSATELSLKLTLVYVQSDGSGSSIPNNGAEASLVRVVSGDGTQVGNEICIKEECFYVISSDEDSVTMLAKYNLYVGGEYKYNRGWISYSSEATGRQDEGMIGYEPSTNLYKGVTVFSNINSAYLGSVVEGYVNNYNSYLITQGLTTIEARLITKDELIDLGCYIDELEEFGYCDEAPRWVFGRTYWSGTAVSDSTVWCVNNNADIYVRVYNDDGNFGVRPVITISKDYL